MGMGISELIANVIARVPTDNTKMVSFAPEKLKKSEKKRKPTPPSALGTAGYRANHLICHSNHPPTSRRCTILLFAANLAWPAQR